MIRLLHGWATAADPIIIHALGFSKVADIVAARFILALTMPPTPEITVNRELGGDIEIGRFEHVAFYNEAEGRMELYLKSLADQTASIAGTRFRFAEGELIHTENSYKYAIAEFRALARRAGFAAVHTWTDRNALFSVHYFRQG
jgi:hypothetical protein